MSATKEELERFQREDLKRSLVDHLQQTLDQRVDRYLEVAHQGIIPGHHFAAASSECLDLYRDGYFLSAVMVSQSVTEGIWKFVLERNQMTPESDRSAQAKLLVERGTLSNDCAEAFTRIFRSFRNDVHHMNASVSTVPFTTLAQRNLKDLAIVEREIFGLKFGEGTVFPTQKKYWDLQADGTAKVFLRNPSIG